MTRALHRVARAVGQVAAVVRLAARALWLARAPSTLAHTHRHTHTGTHTPHHTDGRTNVPCNGGAEYAVVVGWERRRAGKAIVPLGKRRVAIRTTLRF